MCARRFFNSITIWWPFSRSKKLSTRAFLVFIFISTVSNLNTDNELSKYCTIKNNNTFYYFAPIQLYSFHLHVKIPSTLDVFPEVLVGLPWKATYSLLRLNQYIHWKKFTFSVFWSNFCGPCSAKLFTLSCAKKVQGLST